VVAGLPVDAVATIVGRSSGAVRVAAHRGLRELARRLDGAPDEGTRDDSTRADRREVRERRETRRSRAGVTPTGAAALWE
jgi:hypothetical protein